MPLYRYEALDRTGNKVVGAMQASDEGALTSRLLAMGYQLLMAQVAPGAPGAAAPLTSAGRPQATPKVQGGSHVSASERDIARMYQQLYISFRAGMPAFQALHTVSGQIANAGLRQVLYEMSLAIRDGSNLSGMMEQYPRVFRAGDVGILRAAEAGGFLPEAFESLSSRYEQEDNARRRLSIFAGFFHVSLFALFLFVPLAWGLKFAIPALDIKAAIVPMGRAFLFFTLPCCAAYGGFLFALSRIRRSPDKAYTWHKFIMKVPILGRINHLRSTAVFTRSLQWLYHAGVLPSLAWETAAQAVPNVYLSALFMLGKPYVESTNRLSVGMQQVGLLDLNDVGMVATGESTGEIPQALRYLADRYEEEVRTAMTAGVTRMAISFVAWSLLLTPIAIAFLYYCYGNAALQLLGE